MFDLRPIGGTASLYTDLQAEVLDMATKNSIFVAHMISNNLKHTPPLGLLRGFATIRSGEYRNHIDLKMNGVVPMVDLGRITIPEEARHTAIGDTIATADAFLKLVPALAGRGFRTFGEVLAEVRKHGRLLKDLN